jgi:hypothetical protein
MAAMSDATHEARQVAEGARQKEWEGAAFVRDLMNGRLRLPLVHPGPDPDELIGDEARAFIAKLEAFLAERVDPEMIDYDRKIPPEVIDGLREMGAFGLKTPGAYGGKGFTQLEYNRIMTLVASRDASVAALMSAHQSIGIPQPIKLFGTNAQKERLLPKTAAGELSAFALTEPEVGSNPGKLSTSAVLADDGESFILNGEKLWCTNGTIAKHLVVMARTPEGKITAFAVDADTPGITVTHRGHFMGINAIENAVITLEDVRVPADGVIGEVGKGLKLALVTLNYGRLSIPAQAVGVAKQCLSVCRDWANRRVQWGQAIGRHDAVASKLADMAAHTYAMEAVSDLAASMADRGGLDIRLEAALAKLFATEHGWRIVDHAVQIAGGRGYEKERSQRARGEEPIPVERMFRDFRIMRIFEGSTEILHLFISREALDPHLKVAGRFVEGDLSFLGRLKELPRLAWHYGRWYPSRWWGWGHWPRFADVGKLATHLRFVDRTSRRLARSLFHMMVRHGAGLERRQALLFRAVDVGSDLFAMSAAIARADAIRRKDPGRGAETVELADLFCRMARRRVADRFRAMRSNDDVAAYRHAGDLLDGRYAFLREGIVD